MCERVFAQTPDDTMAIHRKKSLFAAIGMLSSHYHSASNTFSPSKGVIGIKTR
jgi:hypothetical protein